MSELAVWNVKYDSIVNFCPVGVVRQKNKFRLRIDKMSDEPWARDAVHFNFLAGDPFHELGLSFRGRRRSALVCSSDSGGGAAIMAIAGILFSVKQDRKSTRLNSSH